MLGNYLFGADKFTIIADLDRYKYSGYDTGFDLSGSLLFDGNWSDKNVIMYGADVSSSVHIDNKK